MDDGLDTTVRWMVRCDGESVASKQGMDGYLAATRIVDWRDPGILSTARALAHGRHDPVATARSCFEYVRDEIRHSGDHRANPVTCVASDVLRHKTGFCYAKSHLLAALLRANRIPAGFCYQRLTIDDGRPPYCLHGLNAVLLPGHGWYRIDARGNREGISADFTPPVERLAFSVAVEGEADLPEIWPDPLPVIVRLLESCSDYGEVSARLPDVEPMDEAIRPRRWP